MALENTESDVVTIYKWLETAAGHMNRTSWDVSGTHFEHNHLYQEFSLIGWVLESKFHCAYMLDHDDVIV